MFIFIYFKFNSVFSHHRAIKSYSSTLQDINKKSNLVLNSYISYIKIGIRAQFENLGFLNQHENIMKKKKIY